MISPLEAIREAARRMTERHIFTPTYGAPEEPVFREERRSHLSPKGQARRRARNRMARESRRRNRP